MTNREFLLTTTSEDADFQGELQICEDKLIDDFVICGYIAKCKYGNDCTKCQKEWLNAERKN